MRFAFVLCLFWSASVWAYEPRAGNGSDRCTYSTSQWDVKKKAPVNRQAIDKPYSEVTADERDPAEPRCSVCREDQVRIDPAQVGWPHVAAFSVCHVYADDVRRALQDIAAAKTFRIDDITGYRVGKTRGAIVDGLRTAWSNHSFGAAVDINARHNGLYGSCDIPTVSVSLLASCQLRVGGAWDPVKRPETTVTASSTVYQAFIKFWKWGGQIRGGTRDMMHFSVTGY